MSRTISRRMLRQSPLSLALERTTASRLTPLCLRPISSTSPRLAEGDEAPAAAAPPSAANEKTPAQAEADTDQAVTSRLEASPRSANSKPKPTYPFSAPPSSRASAPAPRSTPANDSSSTTMKDLFKGLVADSKRRGQKATGPLIPPSAGVFGSGGLVSHLNTIKEDTWQMHIYAHRHNVHITVARPPGWKHPVTGKLYGVSPVPHRTPALSITAGNLGFRKSQKKHYDSAFQLAVFVMSKMNDTGMSRMIEKLEVYLRGFGQGREAVTRVLLGPEGRNLRYKIVKVADATRLKFGGTRSPKPRRLG